MPLKVVISHVHINLKYLDDSDLYYHSSNANFEVSIIGFVNEVLFTHYHSILYLHKRRLVTENIASPSCLFALARGQPCR